MRFLRQDIQKRSEGIAFDDKFQLEETIKERSPEILDLSEVHAKGRIQYDDGFYLLDYDISYELTLPSSRSLEPVTLKESQKVSEVFVFTDQELASADVIDQDLVLLLEGDSISLEESILDNILLAIPLSVLTEEEMDMQDLPSGQDWSLMTESQYQDWQKTQKEASHPFAALDGFFED